MFLRAGPILGCVLNHLNNYHSLTVSLRAGKVSKMYPTSITPSPKMITTYVIAIFVTQIGYCAILVFARRSDTKVCLSLCLSCSLLIFEMRVSKLS